MANETIMRTRQPINVSEIKVLQRQEQPISTERRPSVRRSSIISAAMLAGALLLQGCVTYPVGVYPGYGYYPVAPIFMPVYGGFGWGGWGGYGWRGGWGGYGWRR